MRKALRISALVIGIIILLILVGAVYIKSFLPSVGAAPDLHIVSTPQKIERGKYLATHVMVCMDCHSTRDWSYFAAPMKDSALGGGGERFGHDEGLPGSMYAANITPSGIGSWTDGEIFRAITTGVRKNGKPIFPIMPYQNYGKLDPDDIEAIICYIRTLTPVDNKIQASEYDFPVNFIVNTIPEKASMAKRPDSSNQVAYGEYIVKSAGCAVCHTPFEKGQFDMSMFLAGGRSFGLPGGVVTTPNLTPDKQTGTGTWTKEAFTDKFKMFRDSAYSHRQVDITREFATVMPWKMYAGMTDADLGAIYQYLQSLKPIKHQVTKFQPRVAMR